MSRFPQGVAGVCIYPQDASPGLKGGGSRGFLEVSGTRRAVSEREAMMQDISTTLKGRIGSVPTMKHIKGDTCVTTFRLAIPRWRFTVDARTGNASYVEDGAYWYTIETWDKLADNVVRCCCKGDPVIVVARPVPNAWVDANGQIRSSIVFRASAVGHDMAKGTSRYTKNGAHSTQEPAPGSPNDPFSTRTEHSGREPLSETETVCCTPVPDGDIAGEGAHGLVGTQPQHTCALAENPVDARTGDAGQEPAAVQGVPTSTALQVRYGCPPVAPAPYTHDGSEEDSSDPCWQSVSRFDYSAVKGTPKASDETGEEPEEPAPPEDLY